MGKVKLATRNIAGEKVFLDPAQAAHSRKEEELRKKDERVRKRETEVRKHEEEVRKHEEDLKKREEEVRKCEEELIKCEEEIRKCEEAVRKRTEEAQQKELEARQKKEALDVDMVCARLFILLQVPESFKNLMCLQEHQAQEMIDLLQKVRLVPHHIHLTHLHDYLCQLLDMPSLNSIYKSPFLNAMLRLSSNSGIYPKILVQSSVTIEGSNPLPAGQSGDVWKGTFQDKQVAIKVLRPCGTPDVSQHVKVGFGIFLQRFLLKESCREFFGKRLFGDNSITLTFCRFFAFTIQRTIHRDLALFLHGCIMAIFEIFYSVSQAEIN